MVVVWVLELPCKIFWHEKCGSYGFFNMSYLRSLGIGISRGIGISHGIGISRCIGLDYGIGLGATMQNLSLLP